MFKKKKKTKEKENFLVKTLSMDDLDNLMNKVQRFRNQDECTADDDSIEIRIYSEGNMTISGDFKIYISESI